MFIAVERVIAIVKPFKVKTFCSYELVRAKLCVCYFIAVVFGVLKATEFKLVYNQENSRHTLRFTEAGKNRSLMSFLEIFVVVVYFVIPIVITLICNIIFVALAASSSSQNGENGCRREQHGKQQQEIEGRGHDHLTDRFSSSRLSPHPQS